ncbi:MAG: metal-dependent hydrolase [Planctomycetota bacterium]
MSATITWLGHSAFRLVLPDERVILIDPWLTENPACPAALKKVPRCDMVLMTHGHFDHVGDVPALVKAHDPVVVGNYDLCTVMQKRCGGGRFEGMNTGGTTEFDGIRVSFTRAYHSSGVDSPEGPAYGGMPNGMVVAAEGVAALYHAGDTDVFSDMALIARLFEPKVCILPIGDRFTMGAKGAAIAAELLNPAAIIPCHYKTFPLLAQSTDAFRTALPEHLRKRLHAVEVGQTVPWTVSGIG